MSQKTVLLKPEKVVPENVCANAFSPAVLAVLDESLKTQDPAIIEQAWLCFTEFSPDYW
jgi:hypothetical protein